MQAPWTEIGRLESDVRDIKSQLSQFSKSYELQQVDSNVGGLEHTVREISSSFDGLRYELEALREEIRTLREELILDVS